MTLHLTLKGRWYDLIASGEKKEEYREIKPYWTKRLENRQFTQVLFRNGYSAEARSMLVEIKKIRTGTGRPRWGAQYGVQYYVIELGEIIE